MKNSINLCMQLILMLWIVTACSFGQTGQQSKALSPVLLAIDDSLKPSMNDAEMLLANYGWTIEERLADYQVTLPQSFVHAPGAFPIPIYWAYNNEFSKVIGLPLEPLLGKNVFATVYDLVEPLPSFLAPYTEARAVILTDEDSIVGAWIDKRGHNAFASSLDRRSWDEIVGQPWGEWLVDAGVVDKMNGTEQELATLTSEEVITRYVNAYNRRDVQTTSGLYTRETLIDVLFSNMGEADIFLSDYPTHNGFRLKASILRRDRIRLNTIRQRRATEHYVEYTIGNLYFVTLIQEVSGLGWRIESIGTGP